MNLSNLLISLAVASVLIMNVPAQQRTQAKSGQPETAKVVLQRRHIALTQSGMVAALRSPDPEVRESAAQVLAENGAKDAIPSIVEALKAETVPANQVNIAFWLAQLGEEMGRASLKGTCDDPSKPRPIRMLAAINMRYLKDDYCLPAVVDALQSDDDPDSRMQALSLVPGFGHLSPEESQKLFDLVVKALEDQTPGVRMTASHTLGRLGNVSAMPHLQGALAKEDNETCRLQMQIDLQRLQKQAQPH